MARIITVCSQKGGVGKTTTSINLGTGLAREGKRVLMIDFDSQGDLTTGLGCCEDDDIEGLEFTIASALKKVIGREHPLRMRTLPMTSHVCLGESSACPVRDLEMDLQGNSPAIPSLHRWTICWFTCCAGRRPPRCRAAALCWFGSSRRRLWDSGIGPFHFYPLPRRAAYRSWGNRS